MVFLNMYYCPMASKHTSRYKIPALRLWYHLTFPWPSFCRLLSFSLPQSPLALQHLRRDNARLLWTSPLYAAGFPAADKTHIHHLPLSRAWPRGSSRIISIQGVGNILAALFGLMPYAKPNPMSNFASADPVYPSRTPLRTCTILCSRGTRTNFRPWASFRPLAKPLFPMQTGKLFSMEATTMLASVS